MHHPHLTTPHKHHSAVSTHSQNDPKVKVFCRVRPPSHPQTEINYEILNDRTQLALQQTNKNTKIYSFHRIYTHEPQDEFVRKICGPVIHEAAENKKGSLIFSYGVTNSGKTHTILGTMEKPGILPYLIKYLPGESRITAIQLYNDEFFSLVNRERIYPKEVGGFYDLKKCDIEEEINHKNMEEKIKKYIENRSQSDTKINAQSSRSHAIFRIQTNGAIIGVVDLAGSERLDKINSAVDETSNINKSLLCLGRCIHALTTSPQGNLQLPYRESKLTKVLMEYFVSQCKITMIANIHPLKGWLHENMKVLDYAALAKEIKIDHDKYHMTTKEMIKSAMKKNLSPSLHSFQRSQKKKDHDKSAVKQALSKRCESFYAEENERFAKLLKIKQLETCIQKFQASQETFEFFLNHSFQQQREHDEEVLKRMKMDCYSSPCFERPKEKVDVAVSVSNLEDMEMRRSELKEKLMNQLRERIEQEKRENLVDKQTFTGSSLKKNEKTEKVVQFTPVKKSEEKLMSKFTNSLSAVYSSAKKLFSRSQMKNKQSKKSQLTFFNLNPEYENLFKKEQEEKLTQKQVSIQTESNFHHEENNSQLYPVLNEETSSTNNIINTVSLCVEKKKVKVQVETDWSDFQPEEVEEKAEEKQQEESNHQKKKNKKQAKKLKNREKKKKQEMVAKARQEAARICREKSRTPMKSRLRKHKK